jgi:hypothetical protein
VAIPCEKCGQPVHEQVVICPHCGDASGVPTDPIAVAEIEVMSPQEEHGPSPLTWILQPLPSPATAKAQTKLPKATARRRTREK